MSDPELPSVTLDDVRAWWQTSIVDIEPGVIRVRGYPIEELIGQVSFSAMIWLMLRGELPTDTERALFEAVLVAAVDHGPQAPGVAIARMAMTCGVGINSAVASGVNALGDVHGGAGQQCMELLAAIAAREEAGGDLRAAVEAEVVAYQGSHGRFFPGFGHRFHPVDPRAVRLAAMVRDAARLEGVSGRYLARLEALQWHLSAGRTRPVPVNIDGITATVLLELGFPPALGRGVFVLSRSVGICAHAYEQSLQGGRIKGPTPPAVGYQYTGVAPRSLVKRPT